METTTLSRAVGFCNSQSIYLVTLEKRIWFGTNKTTGTCELYRGILRVLVEINLKQTGSVLNDIWWFGFYFTYI